MRPGAPPLLELRGLTKRFGAAGPLALDGVSFTIAAGEALGLVGESGSGKTTLSRIVARLADATGGDVLLDGEPIGAVPARDFHRSPRRRDVGIVFQDAGESLNPRFTARDAILDPVRRLDGARGGEALRERAEALARRVGLPLDLLDRFPHQLSGGQRARVGIARAIALRPRLLVLDEPTAALDVSVQAVVLRLIDRLRREDGTGVLLVSHDLNVVRMLCERAVVLRAGRVVEEGPSREVLVAPRSDYARALVAAIPHFDPHGRPALPSSAAAATA